MYLAYINELGCDWKDENHYEFLFVDDLTKVENNGVLYHWDIYPASGAAMKPEKELISVVGKLKTDIKLDLIQNSDSFSYYDCIDGVIAMAWQNLDNLDEYPEKRLYFTYGETLSEIKDKLYEIDIDLVIA